MKKQRILFWVDLEMTGLSDEQVIIEIASLVTDAQLNVLAKGPEIAIKRTQEEMSRMEDWPAKQHQTSGLLEWVEKSQVTVDKAEKQTLEFVSKWADKNSATLCGNSIWVDRRFLHKEMPTLEGYLHYRMIDVSSFKEVVESWYPGTLRPPTKKQSHLAMDDIKESLEELGWYRKNIFRQPDTTS